MLGITMFLLAMLAIANRLLVSEPEAAEILGVSERTMFNMRQDGQVPFVRVRTWVMYSPSALEKWIESQEQGPKL